MDPDSILNTLIEQRLTLLETALTDLRRALQLVQATLNEEERARISARLRELMADNILEET